MNRPFSVLALAILLLLVSNQSQAQVCRAYLETPLSTQDFKGLYAKGYSPQVMAPGDFEFPTDRKESLWARLGIQSDRSPLRPPRGFKHQGDLILRNWENRAFKVYYAVAPDETEPSVEEIVIQSLSALPSCKELKQGQVNAAHGRRMSLEASRYLLGEENQFEWGPYILAVEDRKRLFVTKRGMGERNLLDLVESYQVLKEKARKYLASQGTQSTLDQLLIIRDVLAQHGMTRYCRDNATLSILVEGVCANCVGQTLAIIALIKDLGLAIDPNFELAVQVFSDHVRPVLYERQSNRLYDLVYGTSTTVVESILLKPEALLAMSLREKNGFLKNEELEDLNDSKALSLKPQMVKYPGLKLSAEELDSYTINQNPILNTRVDFVNFPFWKSMTIFLEGEPAEQADLSRSLKANWQIQNEQQGSFQGSSPQGSSAAALEASNLFGLSEFIRKQISIYQLHPQSLLESADNFYGKRLVDLVSRLSVYTDKDPRFLFEASQAKRLLSTKQELCDHLNLKCKTSSNVFVGLDDIHTFYLNDKSFGPKGWASSPDASFSFVEKLPFNGFSQGARNLNFNDEESFLKFKSLTLFDRYQWLLGEKQRLEELVVKQWQGRLESKFTAENYFEIYQSEKFHSETQRLIANLSLAIELSIPFQGLTGGSTVLSPQFKDVIPEILSVFVDLRRLAVKNPHTLIKQVLGGAPAMSTEPLVTDRHLSQMINVLLSDMDLRIGFCRKNYSELFRDCAQGNSTGFLYMDELLGWSRPLLEHVALSNSPRYTFKKPVIKTEDGKKNRERQSLPAVNLPKVGAQDDVCQGQTGFVSYGLFYVDCSKDEEAQRTIQLPEWFLYLFVDWASPADMAPHLLFRYQLLLSAVDEPNLKNLASDTKILIDEGHEIVPFKDDGLIESIIACIETQSMCERDLLRRALTNQPGLPVYEWLKQIGFSEDLTQLKSAYPNQPYSSSSNMTIRPSAKVTGALSITGRNGYLYASFFEYEGEFYLVTNKAARHAFLNDEMLLPLVFDQLEEYLLLKQLAR